MADERIADVVGRTGPPPTKIPTPKQIKANSASICAYSMIEDALDMNLMDDAIWADFWQTRGATRLSVLLWAYVNQEVFAAEEEETHSLRRCQGAINGATLHPYMFALLRAYGQESYADAFEKIITEQRKRMAEAIDEMDVTEAGMPVVPMPEETEEAEVPLTGILKGATTTHEE